MKKFFKIFVSVFLILIAYGCRLHYDLALFKFVHSDYSKIPYLENTHRLLMKNEVGVFGNGDHCDFKTFEVRSYKSEDKKKIISFYENKFLETKNSLGEKEVVEIGLYFPEQFREFNWARKEQNWLSKVEKKTAEPLYILTTEFVYSGSAFSIFPFVDLRCL